MTALRPRSHLAAAVVCLALSLTACGGQAPKSHAPSTRLTRETLTIASSRGVLLRLSVQIAGSPAARERGLMNVTHLSDGQGMVFAFPAITNMAFWMKDTVIPLDIAFWNAAGRIVDVKRMQPCLRDPCALYESKTAYIASVEVAGGLLDRAGVRVGDSVSLG